MTLRHFYRDIDGTLTDMSAYAPRLVRMQSRAEESAVGSWSVVLDDPLGELEVVGHRNWFVEDDDSEDEDRILWGGFTGAQTIARMQEDAHRKIGPAARVITVQLFDANAYLARIVMTGSDTNRDPETDVERITWLLGTDEADAIHDVTTFVDTGSPVNMDGAPLRGTYFGQIISDCAEQSGKNHYAFYRWVDGARKLTIWYGKDTLPDYVSPFYLSNDLADITKAEVDAGTAVVWPLSDDATMERSPERQYCRCYLTYEGGATLQANSTNHALIAGGTHQHRDMTTYRPLVKTKTKAQARAQRQLLDVQEQDVRIKTTITGVLQERVTLIKAGMLVKVKGTHWWPSTEDWHNARVLTAEPRPFGPGRVWDIPVELQLIDPGPEGVVDGPAPPPFEGTVFAGLQGSGSDNSEGGGTGHVQWGGTYEGGDQLPGWYTVVTTGPIGYDETSAPFHSITVTEDMVVRIWIQAQFSGVYVVPETVTLNLLVNGGIVGTDSVLASGFWSDTLVIDLRNFALSAGDTISASGISHWGNSGINGTYIKVGRGYVVDDSTGDFVFSGP